ncbi:hypothetical protein PG996_007701 [Apiospora saccharicola]|uniref:Pre-mRNA-splicing factor 38B n=1 Tax=Apiospora saccharicola TaxID=335842 RepID=A0ABR1VBM2_9PEZI
MPPKHELLTDDYVAEVLAKEAADCSLKYSAMGLEAFNQPAKRPAHQPKPNTRFLNNIIRDTTSHNRALLAKESADSAQRLRTLERSKESERQSEQDRHRRQRPDPKDTRKRMLGDIAAIIGDSSKKRRVDDGTDRSAAKSRSTRDSATTDAPKTELKIKGRSTRRNEEDLPESRSSGSRNARKELFADPDARDPTSSKSSRKESTKELFADYDERHGLTRPRRRRSNSRDRRDREDKPSGSSSRHHHHHHSTRDRDHAGESSSSGKHRERRGSHSKSASPPHSHSHSRRPRSPAAARDRDSDSDPLEDLIGPAPASDPQPVRKRGRGAVAGTSGIDRRFASDYDPKVDVALDADDAEDDDWGTSLEALKDRQRWKQQGGDRLRAAGFSDEQVKKWEKGGQDGWGNREEDVRWVKRSEEREWDRGKSATLLEDGALD